MHAGSGVTAGPANRQPTQEAFGPPEFLDHLFYGDALAMSRSLELVRTSLSARVRLSAMPRSEVIVQTVAKETVGLADEGSRDCGSQAEERGDRQPHCRRRHDRQGLPCIFLEVRYQHADLPSSPRKRK